MEDIIARKWIADNAPRDGGGYASGYGDGYGYGYGYVSGSGRGDGSGYGYRDGDGYGYGYGSGRGDGSGYGSGRGDGSCYVSVYCGSKCIIKSINGNTVYLIDGVQTVITAAKKSLARGFILNEDLTLSPCFIVKGDGYFAHGKTIKEANDSLQGKVMSSMDADEAISMFADKFKCGVKYSGREFFKWHNYLTGSCLMGRESFVKNHNIDLDMTYTVEDFVRITENNFGGDVIKQLKERMKICV